MYHPKLAITTTVVLQSIGSIASGFAYFSSNGLRNTPRCCHLNRRSSLIRLITPITALRLLPINDDHSLDRKERIQSLLDEYAAATPQVDRQSDVTKYGRGDMHLSADISEGDVVAYQSGTWYVDGSEVGDGSDPTIRYCLVDTIQIVWTHDCEHGVIRGFELDVENDSTGDTVVERGSCFVVNESEYVDIGPEQLLAKIPTIRDTATELIILLVTFDPAPELINM